MKSIASFIFLTLISLTTVAEQNNNPIAIMKTSKGDITIELYPEQAPVTVANFIKYAESGFYNGTIFHRVIKRFMIQGGGFTKEMVSKTTNDPIVNESGNGLHNDRWTIAMARTSDPDSATAQFFINVKMNSNLDAGAGNPGYAVFGKVTDGQYVVKAIEKVEVQNLARFGNVPVEPVVIEQVVIEQVVIEQVAIKQVEANK